MLASQRIRRGAPGLGAALLLAALSAAAGPVRAQDEAPPPTYQLLKGSTWHVGDVTTTVKRYSKRQQITVIVGGTPVKDDDAADVVESTIVTKVLAVDEHGEVTTSRVHVATWEHEVGDESFTDLTGALLEVTGTGTERSWRALTDDADWSPQTRKWVDKAYGPKKRDPSELGHDLAPDHPVAIGEEWQPEIADLVEALDVKDESEVKATARLARVGEIDGARVAWVDIAVDLPVPVPPGVALTWNDDAKFRMTATGTVPLEPRALAEEANAALEMHAVGTMTQQGVEVEMTMNMDFAMTTKTRVGGEVPEPPPAEEPGAGGEEETPK